MFQRTTLALLLSLIAADLSGQSWNPDRKRDLQWPIPSVNPNVTPFPLLDFNTTPFISSLYYANIQANRDVSAICDTNGQLLFTSNSRVILDKYGDTLPNGDSLGFGLHQFYLNNGTLRHVPNALFLPYPGHDSLYYLFYVHRPDSTVLLFNSLNQILYSLLSTQRNNGLGDVVYKNIMLDEESSIFGLSAVRHSNNRDWWLLLPGYSNVMSRYLIDPEGIHFMGDQPIAMSPKLDAMMIFSPDASRLAWFNWVNVPPVPINRRYYLSVSRIDRETGLLSEEKVIHWDGPVAWMFGGAFSPNSRYFYCPLGYELFQFDTESEDLLATKTLVAEWDGYRWGGVSPTAFGMSSLAPDGKIYITTNSPYLHVIEHPDLGGAACQVVQRAVTLPVSQAFQAMPRFPTYRITSPVGIDESQKPLQGRLHVFPNPASGLIRVTIGVQEPYCSMQMEIVNQLGQILLTTPIAPRQGHIEADVSGFSPGLYFIRLLRNNRMVALTKLAVE